MKPHISFIVAKGKNGVIGNGGKLPWHFPEDLKFFKQTTMGLPVIMGRKTWESIGRPLPGRRNIVITRNKDYLAKGAEVVNTLEEAIKLFGPNDTVMIIGGASVYREALPLADTAWITEIDGEFEGDTFFDDLNPEEWHIVWKEEHEQGTDRPWNFRFVRYDRVRNTSY